MRISRPVPKSPYVHSFGRNSRHVNMGCLYLDERMAHPNSIKDAVIVTLQTTQTGSEKMVSRSSNAMFHYLHRNILLKQMILFDFSSIAKTLDPKVPKNEHCGSLNMS